MRLARFQVGELAPLPNGLQRVTDNEASDLEIDVGPLQAEDFAEAQAERDAAPNDRLEPLAGDRIEQRARLLAVQRWPGAPCALRPTHEGGDVSGEGG
jgi:hypothetical protein